MKATLEGLQAIPVPEPTASYQPVSHYDLARSLRTIGQDMLRNWDLASETYEIARAGQQLFATLSFQKENTDMRLAIGFRNSYDKSMALGIVVGANVIVCANLTFTGEITVMRKHSKNILNSLEDTAITILYRAQYTFDQLVDDSEAMKSEVITDTDAFKALGYLWGNHIISARQLPVAAGEWLNPSHTAFEPRTQWSFYNACTEALKTSPPLHIMERHVNLHKSVVNGKEIWS